MLESYWIFMKLAACKKLCYDVLLQDTVKNFGHISYKQAKKSMPTAIYIAVVQNIMILQL